MIGQNKLLSKIREFTISTLPHSIALVGERGSEQKEVCKYISELFNLELADLDFNYIDSVNSVNNFTMYVVDLLDINEREQNTLLKIYEEANCFVYFILLAESESVMLDTIKTRSYSLKLDAYTRDQLEPLITYNDHEKVLEVCNTPGQIEISNNTDLDALYKLCNSMISSIQKASYSNTLSIADKINFKDDFEKFDLYLFIRVLEKVSLSSGAKYSTFYKYIHDLNEYVWSMNNKRAYFELFLTNIWECSRS